MRGGKPPRATSEYEAPVNPVFLLQLGDGDGGEGDLLTLGGELLARRLGGALGPSARRRGGAQGPSAKREEREGEKEEWKTRPRAAGRGGKEEGEREWELAPGCSEGTPWEKLLDTTMGEVGREEMGRGEEQRAPIRAP